MAAKYTDAAETIIEWLDPETGRVWSVPEGTTGHIPRKLAAWIAAGGTVAPYAPLEIDHDVITRIQFIKQLKAVNKLGVVKTWVQGLGADSDERLEFENAASFKIDDAVIVAMATELGYTAQQLQTFFNNAAGL